MVIHYEQALYQVYAPLPLPLKKPIWSNWSITNPLSACVEGRSRCLTTRTSTLPCQPFGFRSRPFSQNNLHIVCFDNRQMFPAAATTGVHIHYTSERTIRQQCGRLVAVPLRQLKGSPSKKWPEANGWLKLFYNSLTLTMTQITQTFCERAPLR